jgi:hypothetical protein
MTRSFLLILMLFGTVTLGFTASGCSTRPMMTPQEQQANRERDSIERPAHAIDDETSVSDRMGQVGVVILVVGITLAGIILPILLI